MPGVRCQVPGARCQVPGARRQVPGARVLPGARLNAHGSPIHPPTPPRPSARARAPEVGPCVLEANHATPPPARNPPATKPLYSNPPPLPPTLEPLGGGSPFHPWNPWAPGRTAPAGEPRAPPPPRPSPPPRARRRAGGGGAPRIRIAPPRPPWGEEGGAGGDSRRRPRARGGGAIRGGHPARWQGSLLLHFSPSFLLRFCFVSPSFLLRFYPSFLLMMTLVTML